jgi:hypothetical protein
MAFYELRQYKALPGQREAFIRLMEEEIVPFQVRLGMVITGMFRGETDDTAFIWLRRFESEEQRVALYKAVYDTAYWKETIAPKVTATLDRSAIVVTRILPTATSVLQ